MNLNVLISQLSTFGQSAYNILNRNAMVPWICFFFVLSFTRSNVLFSPTLISHFQKRQSFLSNGIKNMHIPATGSELQAVRFGCYFRRELKKRVQSFGAHSSGMASPNQHNLRCNIPYDSYDSYSN